MPASTVTKRAKPLAAIELDKALRPHYTEALGFPGAAALHATIREKHGSGSASLKRVRAWVATRKVGAYLQVKPPRIQYARFTETKPNNIHQSDVLFLPHDKVTSTKVAPRGTYKYVLTLVDVASRYKAAAPLKTKDAATVARELEKIYSDPKNPLTWPKSMMVDLGGEFMAATTKMLQKHKVRIRRADKGHHRSQAFVESFNKVLAQRLFRSMYHRGFEDGAPSNAWVKNLPKVVASMNNTKTRMIGMKPADAIKLDRVPLRAPKKTEPAPAPLSVGALVHIATNEAVDSVDERRRATDPWWSTKAYPIAKRVDGASSLYYFTAKLLGKHGYARSQLRLA